MQKNTIPVKVCLCVFLHIRYAYKNNFSHGSKENISIYTCTYMCSVLFIYQLFERTVSLPFRGPLGPYGAHGRRGGMAHGLSEPRTFWKNEKTVWGNLEKHSARPMMFTYI